MNGNINMDSTIAGSMNDNINHTCQLYRFTWQSTEFVSLLPPTDFRCFPIDFRCFPIDFRCFPTDFRCFPTDFRCFPIDFRCFPTDFRCFPVDFRCFPVDFRCFPIDFRCFPTDFRCFPTDFRCFPFDFKTNVKKIIIVNCSHVDYSCRFLRRINVYKSKLFRPFP